MRRLAVLLLLLVGLGTAPKALAVPGWVQWQTPDGVVRLETPPGWQPVQDGGPAALLLRDPIWRSENVSVIRSPLAVRESIRALGSPSEVGYILQRDWLRGPGITVELVDARERWLGSRPLYQLEFAVHRPDGDRHDLAAVLLAHGEVISVTVSTPEPRWRQAESLLRQLIASLAVG